MDLSRGFLEGSGEDAARDLTFVAWRTRMFASSASFVQEDTKL
jgi:hypothetical protein